MTAPDVPSAAEMETPLAHRLQDSSPDNRRYAVRAIWRTLQGEGAWAGRPAVFVRLAGCNLWSGYEADRDRDAERSGAACPRWCDTDFRKEGAAKLSAEILADEAVRLAEAADVVVLTGGEPLLQADARLVRAFHEAGFEVACETNGTQRLTDRFRNDETGEIIPPDWVVCSPKHPPESLAIEQVDELKLVVPDYRPSSYASFAHERVREHRLGGQARRFLWLQPEDGPRLAEATRLAVDLAHKTPGWRVSVQTHKVLGLD